MSVDQATVPAVLIDKKSEQPEKIIDVAGKVTAIGLKKIRAKKNNLHTPEGFFNYQRTTVATSMNAAK